MTKHEIYLNIILKFNNYLPLGLMNSDHHNTTMLKFYHLNHIN